MMINTRVRKNPDNGQWIGEVERVIAHDDGRIVTKIVESTNAYPTWHMAMSMVATDAQNLRVIHGIA